MNERVGRVGKRERHRQTDRQTERRYRDTETDRDRQTETDRQTECYFSAVYKLAQN